MSKLANALAMAGIGVGAMALGMAARSEIEPAVKAERITVSVLPGAKGSMGPDNEHHDTIAPSDFVLHQGVPVTFTVINYDDGIHTIFAPGLDLNITIEPATHPDGAKEGDAPTPTTTTFTFTPEERGEFRWQCVVMCDAPSHWAMSDDHDGPGREGFMAGWIKVL
jgi:heme/copper-type cytochrome/quinol oxidase subunit 2